jgi:hypothetical protein
MEVLRNTTENVCQEFLDGVPQERKSASPVCLVAADFMDTIPSFSWKGCRKSSRLAGVLTEIRSKINLPSVSKSNVIHYSTSEMFPVEYWKVMEKIMSVLRGLCQSLPAHCGIVHYDRPDSFFHTHPSQSFILTYPTIERCINCASENASLKRLTLIKLIRWHFYIILVDGTFFEVSSTQRGNSLVVELEGSQPLLDTILSKFYLFPPSQRISLRSICHMSQTDTKLKIIL